MSKKKCPHFKRRDQWCRHCSEWSVNINLNHIGKKLNQGYNVKEYILLGYNNLKENEAVEHLRAFIEKEKAHLLPYANNVIYRNNRLDTVVSFKPKTDTSKSVISSLSQKLTHH